MKILGYKGISFISHLIKFQTRSEYSHIGVMLDNGQVYEAWQSGGVRLIAAPQIGHKPGTPIDVYNIIGEFNEQAIEAEGGFIRVRHIILITLDDLFPARRVTFNNLSET
ncbi:MAG: hypothetical protein GY809_08010, partial [Planctomycetes bacterium]|nr:hypothetical protein [Planctomycetota bacterium]